MTIILGGPMIGMYPHVAEFVERFHREEQDRSHRASDHEREQHSGHPWVVTFSAVD